MKRNDAFPKVFRTTSKNRIKYYRNRQGNENSSQSPSISSSFTKNPAAFQAAEQGPFDGELKKTGFSIQTSTRKCCCMLEKSTHQSNQFFNVRLITNEAD